MNRLDSEKSAYLKHAAGQKIEWYPWSDEPFERARKEDKPVFLSTGAIWCHWCHVMAKESFENDEIARILNEHFVCIKLDRDERPDIDRRYQQAVSAMGNGSGWPLSVFLTSERKPFFGGTYFPPEDSHGRPGFRKVLESVADFYRDKRHEVEAYAGNLVDYLRPGAPESGEIQAGSVDKAEAGMLSEFDPRNGGFGTSPKFPMCGAIEFLLNRYFLTGKESTGYAARKTLEAMAGGGFHDHLGGGFHRYSVDEGWIVPHFEKMADDNAWLLRNYAAGYAVFGDEHFRAVGEGIISFVREALSDPGGGFFASQDADVTPDDEGGYFTWTAGDFRKLLSAEEFEVLSLHLLDDRGSMHHAPDKKVLFIAREPEEIAEARGMDLESVKRIIGNGKRKLLQERRKRETPFTDRTMYTSLNGMMIASFLDAFRVFGDTTVKDFALKSLDRILGMRFDGKRLFRSEDVKGVFDDHIFLAEALISAYEVTGGSAYLDRAEEMTGICLKRFWDDDEGGFFDTEDEILGGRLKTVEDMPHPSANAAAVIQLLKLFAITGKDVYDRHAGKALRAFAKREEGLGIHAGHYFSALDLSFNLLSLSVGALPGSALAETAVSCFSPYKSISYSKNEGRVTPCLNGVCYEPVGDPDKLRAFLRHPS